MLEILLLLNEISFYALVYLFLWFHWHLHHCLYISLLAVHKFTHLVFYSFRQCFLLGFYLLHTWSIKRFYNQTVQLLLKISCFFYICLQVVLDSDLCYSTHTRYIWLKIWISSSDYYSSSLISRSSTWSAKPMGRVTADCCCFDIINYQYGKDYFIINLCFSHT